MLNLCLRYLDETKLVPEVNELKRVLCTFEDLSDFLFGGGDFFIESSDVVHSVVSHEIVVLEIKAQLELNSIQFR